MERTEATVKEALTVQLMAGDITKEAAKAKLIKFRTMQAEPQAEEVQEVAQDPNSLALPLADQQVQNPLGSMSGSSQFEGQGLNDTDWSKSSSGMIPSFEQVKQLPSAVGEMITGNERSTPEIEGLPYAGSMPEMNQFSMGAAKVGFGTLFTDINETVEIFRANFPNVAIRQDAKGNYIFKSNIDGKEYGLQPGFGAADIPSAAAAGTLAVAAGTGSLLANALAAITIEAGVEGSQSLAGGTFNPENVALAGGLGVLGDAAMRGAQDKLIPSIRKMMGRGDNDALRKTAMETPEAFQTAQRQGPLYHSTDADFEDFKLGETKSGRELGDGIYFSTEPQTRYGKNIKEAYVDIKKPWTRDAAGISKEDADIFNKAMGSSSFKAKSSDIFSTKEDAKSFVNRIRSEGKDGVSVTRDGENFKVQYTSNKFEQGQSRDTVQSALNNQFGPSYTEVIKEAGYDGVISVDGKTIMPLSPSQISKEAGNVAEEVVESTIDAGTQKNLGKLAQEATRSTKKKKAFAKLATQNPEARKTMKRLGMDLPPDVTSDSQQFIAASMAPRLDDASKASALWTQQLKDSSQRSTQLMKKAGAGDSGVDVSSKILDDMVSERDTMKKLNGEVIGAIDDKMPDKTPVLFFSGKEVADDLREALDESMMTSEVKKSLNILERGEGTYLTLRTMKEQVRNAKSKLPSQFSGLSKKSLDQLDTALKADQIDNVSQYLGKEAGASLKEANVGYAKAADLDKTITKLFKSDTGSIGLKLKNAVKSVGTDDKSMNDLLELVPKNKRSEMLMTGIMENSRATTSGARLDKGSFGFSEFADTYRNMKKNTKFMVNLAKTVGPKNMNLLKDLDTMSNRITKVRAFQTRNGKDLAPMLKAMQAENFVSAILKNPAVRAMTTMGASAAPFVGRATNAGLDAVSGVVSTGGDKAMDAIGNLMKDPELLSFIDKAVIKAVDEKTASKLAKSQSFLKFSKRAGIANPTQWIMQAVRTQPEDESK